MWGLSPGARQPWGSIQPIQAAFPLA